MIADLPLIRALRRPAGMVGGLLGFVVIVIAVVGPVVTRNPDLTDYANQLAGPSHAHWLGTDEAGRDELARTVAGLRTSLVGALLVFALTTSVGLVVGAAAGYAGGVVDAVVSRIVDVLLGLPSIIVALAVVGVLGVGYGNLVAAISFSGWALTARVARSYVVGSRHRLDVIAARMAGTSEARILTGHVLPGTMANVLVVAATHFGGVILAFAGLSFLGLGAQPPAAELGEMLSDSRGSLASAPWLAVGPTLGILLSVAAATLLSDALRDVADPRHAPPRWRRERRQPTVDEIAAEELGGGDTVIAYRDLEVTYADGTKALRRVSFDVRVGECLAVVGESGCGKTTLARASLGILPGGTRVTGRIHVGGLDTLALDETQLSRRLRGVVAGYVAQDPYQAYDPLQRVGHHITEAWRAHRQRVPAGEPETGLTALGIDATARRLRQRPFQWSGGMLQRATILAANAHHPLVTIADEPTSALDAELADDVIRTLRQASRSVLLIGHDLRLVAAHADRIAVMHQGQIVEIGPTHDVIGRPRHPYTATLLDVALLDAAPPDRRRGDERRGAQPGTNPRR